MCPCGLKTIPELLRGHLKLLTELIAPTMYPQLLFLCNSGYYLRAVKASQIYTEYSTTIICGRNSVSATTPAALSPALSPVLAGHTAAQNKGLHFPATLAARFIPKPKFWATCCKQKYCVRFLEMVLKVNRLR